MVLDPKARSNQENPNPNMATCPECGAQIYPEGLAEHAADAHPVKVKPAKTEHEPKVAPKTETKTKAKRKG